MNRRASIALVLAWMCGAPWSACSNGGDSAAVGPAPSAPATFPAFATSKTMAGVSAAHALVPDYYITGQAWGDYDRDGHIDLYVTNSAGPNTLYHNRGDGTFEVSPVNAEVALPSHASGGTVFADYDNDGWPDLLVLNLDGNVLFHNDAGTHFTDVTVAAGVVGVGTGLTASFGDYDNDGYLDLYVANWACLNCRDFLEGMRDHLFHNRGDGTFADVTPLLGSRLTVGYGFIGGFVDFDDDGDLDIYLVNDKGRPGPLPPIGPMNRNVLWRNDGAGPNGWVFSEIAEAAGADARLDGMGLAVGDCDGDGHLDLAVSNHGRPVLLHNRGGGSFEDIAEAAGVPVTQTSWGLFFADFNNDGHQDLFVAGSDPTPSVMLENLGPGAFRDVSVPSGTSTSGYTIGAACADYDGDGWLDYVVGFWGDGYRLYRNLGLPRDHHWFRVRLEGAGPVNRDAVGARVWLQSSTGQVQMQEVACGSSVGSGHDLALHFGLGAAVAQELTIRWPDGLIEHLTGLASDQELRHRHP